ncbi:MAG: hypothetical protein KJ718_01780 [Nanoarchaeota archaeon]|nr:hypothetical protein [Nanoarchaeota archaeon]
MAKDEWEEKFEKWRKEKKRKVVVVASDDGAHPARDHARDSRSLPHPPKNVSRNELAHPHRKEPGHINILRAFVWLIPIVIIVYLVFSNFIVNHEFVYVYDLGDEGEKYLTPAERVSDVLSVGEINYRELTRGLVYFDVEIPRGGEKVFVNVRLKDNFPEGGKISIGAKDEEEWHYLYNLIFNPNLDLSAYDSVDRVYRINPELELLGLEELKLQDGVIVAAEDFEPIANYVEDYSKEETVIDLSLRGGHVFYVYAEDYLDIEFKKQDLNWYEGSDELRIVLYDLQGRVMEFTEIQDDGETEKTSKLGAMQSEFLVAVGLERGVYKLEFSDFDGLIREIKINTNKIVAEKVFLADNSLYGLETRQSRLYTDYDLERTLKFLTYHEAGLQKIFFNNGQSEMFDFSIEDEPAYRKIGPGKYMLTFLKNDIVVESPEYFAFTEEGYFHPWKQKVVPANRDSWVFENVDYLVTDYKQPVEDGDWIIVGTEFDIAEDGLFVKDNKLSLVFNVPHLSKDETKNYTIPVDWIEIKVFKPGAFS